MKDNNFEQILNEHINKDQKIDIKAELLRLFGFWKFFVISLLLSLALIFVYLRYTKPVYKISARVIVKDPKNNVGNNQLISELDLFADQSNIHNEIGIIKSKSLSRKTVRDLDFYILYFYESSKLGREVEIYDECPYKIEIDTSHLQLLYTPVNITFLSKDNISVEIDNYENFSYYDYSREKILSTDIAYPKAVKTTIKIGDTFTNNYFSFKVVKNPEYETDFQVSASKKFHFLLTDPSSVGDIYASSLEVSAIEKDASIIEISCKSNVPSKATAFINKLCENYINLDLEEKNLTAIKTIEFIDSQLGGITDSLVSVEDILEHFKSKNKIIDISAESKQIISDMADQQKEEATQNIKVKYYEYLLNCLTEKTEFSDLVNPAYLGITDPSLTSLVSELITLSNEKTKLSVSSTEKNPFYVAIEKNILTTKKTLKENVQNSLNIAKLTLSDLKKTSQGIKASMSKLPKTERDLLTIQRKFNISDETYSFLLQKRAEASIAKASNYSDNKIVDSAEIIAKVHPNKTQYYLFALIIGILFPVVILIFREYLDDNIKDKREIALLTNLPLLGAIAHSKYTSPLVIVSNPRAMISETIRNIKANLDFVAPGKECNIIAFTSTVSGEGKTFCSINMACAFALADKKTILIGCDLRKPKIFGDFNLTNDEGLTSYLIGKTKLNEIIKETGVNNLCAITAGPVPPNPAELLGSEKMKNLFSELKSRFDCIIVDTPPIGIVSDALFLMKQTDVNIYVLRQNYTSKKVLGELNTLIKTTGIKNVNLILNDVHYKKSKYGKYYNRYGYTYSSYYSGYYEE